MKLFQLLPFFILCTGISTSFGMLTQKIKDENMSYDEIVRYIKTHGKITEEHKNSISDEKIEVYRYEESLKPYLGITWFKRVYSVPVGNRKYKVNYEFQTKYIAWTLIAATVAFQLWSISNTKEAPVTNNTYDLTPLFCGS